MKDVTSKLSKYAELEGTELGEACTLLCQLANYEPYLGESFYQALTDEIRGQLHNFVAHSKIVDSDEQIVVKRRELKWIDVYE